MFSSAQHNARTDFPSRLTTRLSPNVSSRCSFGLCKQPEMIDKDLNYVCAQKSRATSTSAITTSKQIQSLISVDLIVSAIRENIASVAITLTQSNSHAFLNTQFRLTRQKGSPRGSEDPRPSDGTSHARDSKMQKKNPRSRKLTRLDKVKFTGILYRIGDIYHLNHNIKKQKPVETQSHHPKSIHRVASTRPKLSQSYRYSLTTRTISFDKPNLVDTETDTEYYPRRQERGVKYTRDPTALDEPVATRAGCG